MARSNDGNASGGRRETLARSGGPSAFLAAVAGLIVVLPVGLGFFDGRRAGGPETHPSFDGEVHVLPGATFVAEPSDVGARIDGAIAVLLDGSTGLDAERPDERDGAPEIVGPAWAGDSRTGDVEPRLESRLADHGLTGSWRTASLLDLERLRPPYLVPVATRAGPSVVVVRRLHAGFVYGFEPTRGDVLYPSEAFERAWSGRVRTLSPPLELDAFWE